MRTLLTSRALFVIAAFALLAVYPLVAGNFGRSEEHTSELQSQ